MLTCFFLISELNEHTKYFFFLSGIQTEIISISINKSTLSIILVFECIHYGILNDCLVLCLHADKNTFFMSDHHIYNELISKYKDYDDTFNALHRLRSNEGEEITNVYKQIKNNLIETSYFSADSMINIIKGIIRFNNRYVKGYKSLMTKLCQEFHLDKYDIIQSIPNLHEENTIYNAIVNDDIDAFISFTEQEGFNLNQKSKIDLYPIQDFPYSLIELCSYYGSVKCFKLLRSKYNSKTTRLCLYNSFLGENPDIMSECMKEQKINGSCMQYSLAVHNIDFVTYLMNEHNLEIELNYCYYYHNIHAYFIYLDQTNNFNECFTYSPCFFIPNLIEYLFSHVSDINFTNKGGMSALHYSSVVNNKSAAEFLIAHGANVATTIKMSRKSSIHIAAEHNSLETANLLITYGADVNAKSNQDLTPLHHAALFNSKETAELLIAYGADIHAKTSRSFNALHFAARENSKEIAELLIACGIDVNAIEDNYKKSALHYAAENGCEEIVKFLISNGADINIRDNLDYTALHCASCNGNKEIIETLLSHGADINAKGFHDMTPLCCAITHNEEEAAKFLISRGAKIKP